MTVTDAFGKPVYKKPLFLGISGERRHEITAKQAYDYYHGRYDIEHFFRFGKDKLLFDAYQTPDVEHEERWWKLALLAYTQLYLSRKDVALLPKKWERYLPAYQSPDTTIKVATPSQTQRAFSNVLDDIGTPAKACLQRGNPTGRKKGDIQQKRERQKTIFKMTKKTKKTIMNDSGISTKNSDPIKIEALLNSVKKSLKKLDCSPETFYQLLQNTT